MKRQQLHRYVIGHVEHEDFNHVGQAQQRTEHCSPGKDQKNAAEEFGAPGENLVRRRSPDRRPQNAHRREIAITLEQAREIRKRHLQGNKLIHAVGHHLARKAEADEQPEPLVKSGVVGAFAVECRPDGSHDYRKPQHAREQDPVESFVAATTAGVDERFAHAKNMRGRPENNRADRPESRRVGNVEVGDGDKAGEDLRGQTINAEVHETESEGHAS